MAPFDLLWWFHASNGLQAAHSIYTHRAALSQEMYRVANRFPSGPKPGADAVYRTLRSAGVSRAVASRAQVAAGQAIEFINSGGCF